MLDRIFTWGSVGVILSVLGVFIYGLTQARW